MSSVTPRGLINILLGTELGGDADKQYVVSFAVPNVLLGKRNGGNSSGFSFGVVQLDIGSNSFAQKAFREILDAALRDKTITAPEHQHYLAYSGLKRPDLVPQFAGVYRQDRSALTSRVFTAQSARDVIDKYTLEYVATTLHPSVDRFLDAVTGKWGTGTVFDPAHPDYATALAAMTSISNRTGGLNGSTMHFLNIHAAPRTIESVKDRYDAVLSDHWHLVLEGVKTYKAGGQP